jgi:hypothetical protein
VLVDGAQRLAQWRWGRWLVGGQQRDEDPVVDLGVEDREAEAVRGQGVGVGVRQPFDQAFEPQPAQVVAGLPIE